MRGARRASKTVRSRRVMQICHIGVMASRVIRKRHVKAVLTENPPSSAEHEAPGPVRSRGFVVSGTVVPRHGIAASHGVMDHALR